MKTRCTVVLWETKDGRLMSLSEMTETHIMNCIAKIERSIRAGRPWRAEALPYLRMELSDRNRLENIEGYWLSLDQWDD